jgi:hypothetical protein
MQGSSTTIRQRTQAGILVLLTFVVFAFAALPPCGGVCCDTGDEASIHRQMPCCETPSVSPRDPAAQTARIANLAPQPVVSPADALPAASALPVSVCGVRAIDRDEHPGNKHRPAVFLLNGQFRI